MVWFAPIIIALALPLIKIATSLLARKAEVEL